MNLSFEHVRLPRDAHFGAAAIAADLCAVRERAPPVHNVTNFVVMQQTANALLALGASPIMAHAEADLNKLRGIGTLAGLRSDELQVGDIVHKVGRTTGVRSAPYSKRSR